MSRGSRNLAEPVTMKHLVTGDLRLATTKADHVNLTAAGYREPKVEGTATPPSDAAVVEQAEAEDHEKRVAAAKKAAATRRRNAESGDQGSEPTSNLDATTTETPVGASGDADAPSA